MVVRGSDNKLELYRKSHLNLDHSKIIFAYWRDRQFKIKQSSFVRNYLIEEIGISESRLVPLNLPEDYEKALNDGPDNGGVVAIVDERPYIELFLSTRCQFRIVGQDFTRTGWGFVSEVLIFVLCLTYIVKPDHF